MTGYADLDIPDAGGSMLGERIGDYELLEQIGRGGMGVVYRARQAGLARVVAVKLISAGMMAREEDLRRFQTEARTAAMLRHPNIVTIHEIGRSGGQPFLVMEFIEGRDLSDLVRESPMLPREAAACLRTLAEAIHHAHERGVVHRDLKPSNIIIDSAGLPHILDFGLAKSSGEDPGLTTTGAVMGSPSYMAPEQARGGGGEVGTSSDVYALGAVFYEMLTGRAPFRAATPVETLRLVAEEEPVAPRRLNPRLPLDLETICLKCLAKEPGRRYATAGEVAQELDRFLRAEPILARPISSVARGWRWCRRKPMVAGLWLALFLSLVGAAGVSAGLVLRLKRTRDEIGVRANEVEEKSKELRARLVQMSVASGLDLVMEDKMPDALPWLAEALRLDAGNPATETAHRLRFVSFLHSMPRLAQMWFVESTPRKVQFETNGGISVSLALGEAIKKRYYGFGSDEPVREVTEVDELPKLPPIHNNQSSPLPLPPRRLSPDGRQAATVPAERILLIVDAQTGKALSRELDHGSNIRDVSYSADGSRLLTRTWETARVWDAATYELLAMVRHAYLTAAVLDREGGRLLTGAADGALQLWQLPPPDPGADFGTSLLFTVSPDGRFAFSRNAAGRYLVRDLVSREAVDVPWGRAEVLTGGSWCAALRELFLMDEKGGLWLTRAGGSEPARILAEVPTGVRVQVSDSGTRVALWSEAMTQLEVRGPGKWNEPISIIPCGSGIRGAVFDANGGQLLTYGNDGIARVWDPESGRALTKPIAHGGPVSHAAFSVDGAKIVTGGDDGYAKLWDARTGEAAGSPLFQGNPVMGLAVSSDARRVATLTIYGVRVWNAITGRSLTPVMLHAAPVSTALFSADGQRLVTGAIRDRPHLWDADTGLWLASPSETRLAWLESTASWLPEAHGLPLPWLGRIPGGGQSVDVLARVAAVMSGRQLDGAGGIVPIETTQLAQAWLALTNRPKAEQLR